MFRRYIAGMFMLVALLLPCWSIAPALAQSSPLMWEEDLGAAGSDSFNIVQDASGLRLSIENVPQAGAEVVAGQIVFPVRALEHPVSQVRATVAATVPPGASVLVEVRLRSADDQWSEWHEASGDEPASFEQPGADVQVRVSLTDDGQGNGPAIQRVELYADDGAGAAQGQAGPAENQPTAAEAQVARTYHVFATREGLVGYRTANGHLIQPNDRFVALPSRRALASNGGYEYQVRVCYSKTQLCTIVPVWDVGPWNTRDDYWNPASLRQMWKDLPQGLPEAQAANRSGYNGGRDQFGRRVPNPAGIDLADGVFGSALRMTNNDWVEVTYLWTGSAARSWPLVRSGQNSERVKTIQYRLKARGYTLAVDGTFGPATEAAVKRFQAAKGLAADGVVGTNTWQALIITTRLGDTGSQVRAVQSQLVAHGYTLAVDEQFGPATQAAVKHFQTSASLAIDGIVGPNTWAALVR